MLKIPKSIKVGAHDIKVEFPHEFIERTDLTGAYRFQSQIMLISDTDSYGKKRAETNILSDFIHEVLHAISMIHGIHIFESEDGENNNEKMSEALAAVLIDNGFVDLGLDLSGATKEEVDWEYFECGCGEKKKYKSGLLWQCPKCKKIYTGFFDLRVYEFKTIEIKEKTE